MQQKFPEPTSEALAASTALQDLIVRDIARSDGWISFARYMELVLYAPGLGYYSGGAAKLGKDGDFTTAPEITPLFGAALARVVAGLMPSMAPNILEFGAGTGKLARDILTELIAMGVKVERYSIVDLSGELRGRQQEMLKDFPQVSWLDQMPDSFSGIVIGNEVLDAIPVNLVIKNTDGWSERGVAFEDGRFDWRDLPCVPSLIAQIPDAANLPEAYVTEIHPIACGFMRSLAMMLGGAAGGGVAILIDYGFPAHEYYHVQRTQGTLMCHYRHYAHADPFYLPGLQDVTAHVNFTAMARHAIDNGLELLGYTSQAAFLLEAGISEVLLRTSPDDPLRYLPQANAVQKLISPAEMGELFKVLVVGTDAALPGNFARSDRSHRL